MNYGFFKKVNYITRFNQIFYFIVIGNFMNIFINHQHYMYMIYKFSGDCRVDNLLEVKENAYRWIQNKCFSKTINLIQSSPYLIVTMFYEIPFIIMKVLRLPFKAYNMAVRFFYPTVRKAPKLKRRQQSKPVHSEEQLEISQSPISDDLS